MKILFVLFAMMNGVVVNATNIGCICADGTSFSSPCSTTRACIGHGGNKLIIDLPIDIFLSKTILENNGYTVLPPADEVKEELNIEEAK